MDLEIYMLYRMEEDRLVKEERGYILVDITRDRAIVMVMVQGPQSIIQCFQILLNR